VVHSVAKVRGLMEKEEHSHRRLRFGVFEMDFRTGELRKHGMQVRLQKQPFQVLAMLLEHAGEVVTREELQKNLWPADTFVDFDHGLNKTINKIREALGDSAKSPRFVETVSRRGYVSSQQYAVMTAKEALPKAKAAAIKALELDNNLGEAHNSLAFCLDGFDWNFAAAEKEFRRAIELNPSYATAHHWYAWHLSLLGRNSEAISEMKKAKDLDPLSLIINADLAELYLIAHSYDESIQQSRRTIEMDANFALAHNQLAQAYLQKQMFDEAVAELQKAIKISGGSPTFTANLARTYAAMGRKNEAGELLDDLKKHSSPGYSRASEIAAVYVALGDNARAMT
jgi:DNA-binding winged helix-turn-helix (wHTH) protein